MSEYIISIFAIDHSVYSLYLAVIRLSWPGDSWEHLVVDPQ